MPASTVLIVGYAQRGFGFGRVVGALAEHFPAQARLWHFDLGGAAAPAGALAAREGGGKLLPGEWAGALAQALQRIQPNAILFYADLEVIGVLAGCARTVAPRALRVGYCPIEGELADPGQCRALQDLHEAILFSSFAAGQVRAAFAARGVQAPKLSVLPHGTDSRAFHPLCADPASARRLARQALFPHTDLEGAFIVLNANRNQNRKRLDISLRAFAQFAAGKERVFLLLHSGLQDEGIRVLRLAAALGISSRLLLPCFQREHPVVDEHRLNLIYNACDVGLNTAEAEGWGLVSFEHGATGAAQVVPDYATPAENWRDFGLLIGIGQREPWVDYVAAVPDPASAARCLELLHADRQALSYWSARAAENAARMWSWQQVAQRMAHTLLA